MKVNFDNAKDVKEEKVVVWDKVLVKQNKTSIKRPLILSHTP